MTKTITMVEVKAMKWNAVRQLATQLGVSAKGTRPEIEARIEDVLTPAVEEVKESAPSTDLLFEEEEIMLEQQAKMQEAMAEEIAKEELYVVDELPEEMQEDQEDIHFVGGVDQFCRKCKTNRIDIIDPTVCSLLCYDCQPNASVASEPKASEQPKQQQPKAFEFVSANNYGVRFKQRGELIRVGWNIQDGKSYMVKGDGKPTFVMLDDVINKLKAAAKLTIEKQAVGQIINAMMKVKSNYKVVRQEVIRRRNASAQQTKAQMENVSPSVPKENGKKAKRGTVDVKWLSAYKTKFEDKHGRQPNGAEIMQGWEIRLAKINA